MFSSRIVLIGCACLLAGVVAGWGVRDGLARIIDNWEKNDGWVNMETAEFSLSYPDFMTTAEAEEPYYFLSDVEIALATDRSQYEAPNYRQEGWVVVSTEQTDEAGCFAAEGQAVFEASEQIGDRSYRIATFSSAGMGHRYDTTLHRTFVDGTCYEVAETLHASSDYTDVDEEEIEDAQYELQDVLSRVVDTFRLN